MQASRPPVSYPEILLYIDGKWCGSTSGRTGAVLDPNTGRDIGQFPFASRSDVTRATAAAARGFDAWRNVPAFERYKTIRKAAENLRRSADSIAELIALEVGKPLAQAKGEAQNAADVSDWFAEEARRTYGSVIPARSGGIRQIVSKEPVGPVAALTPWNFPVGQAVRKIAAALAAGCSVILKGSEETPASCMALVRAYADAGLPDGALGLLFGTPAEISEQLIADPVIRKVSFTGSTAVGKHLAMLAGKHMKRVTMELGGHAPAIVFDDADVEGAATLLAAAKFRNAGQICTSPTRFLIQENAYEAFLAKFISETRRIKVGNSLDPETTMGPLANSRRVEAVERFLADAQEKGGSIEIGGKRIGNEGHFFEPTVLTNVPTDAALMNEEVFGPIAPIARFKTADEALREANRLAYGLAAYVYTRQAKTAAEASSRIESGMIAINHQGIGPIETPFGGVKDSGYGTEGGREAIDAYVVSKFVTEVGV